MKHHPEQQDDEVYMGNQDTEEYWNSPYRLRDLYNRGDERREWISWETRRTGKVAYDTEGNVIKTSDPVFVKRQEIEAAIAASGNPELKRIWQGMLDRGRAS